MMVRLEDIFVPPTIPHQVSKANCMKVSKIQLEFWHAVMAKFHDLLARLAIDQATIILGVVVVHNEEGMVQLRGSST